MDGPRSTTGDSEQAKMLEQVLSTLPNTHAAVNRELFNQL
jgi:hypothetical protein